MPSPAWRHPCSASPVSRQSYATPTHTQAILRTSAPQNTLMLEPALPHSEWLARPVQSPKLYWQRLLASHGTPANHGASVPTMPSHATAGTLETLPRSQLRQTRAFRPSSQQTPACWTFPQYVRAIGIEARRSPQSLLHLLYRTVALERRSRTCPRPAASHFALATKVALVLPRAPGETPPQNRQA